MHAADPPTLVIGSAPPRRVGAGSPTYVIAEAGVNHNGSVQTALRMIRAARDAGAQAVKFQAFRADELVCSAPRSACASSADEGVRTGSWRGMDQHAMLSELELDADAFCRLHDACRDAGIEFLATPFDRRSLELLVELDVAAIKIASTDLTNTPLLEAALQTRRPLIVSTGASRPAELDRCVRLIRSFPDAGAALLHCVSAYPVEPHAANLGRIRTLAERYGLVTGYSDHTSGIRAGALAVAAGAAIVEKHFTLDCSQAGPDHAFSLEPPELRAYVDRIRQAELMVGDGRLELQDCEQEIRSKAGRSLVAARLIRAGQTLSESMLALKRPGGGLSAEVLPEIVGRVATRDIAAEERVEWSMVQ